MESNPYESPRADMGPSSQDAHVVEGDPSLLVVELVLEDHVAFNRQHLNNSPTIRRQKLIQVVVLGVVAFGVAAAVSRDFPILVTLPIAFVFWLGTSLMYYFYSHQRATTRTVRRMLSEGDPLELIGVRELEVDEVWLAERTEKKQTRVVVSSVCRIVETSEHVFIYVSPLHAHVIPKQRVLKGDPQRFVQRVRELSGVESSG